MPSLTRWFIKASLLYFILGLLVGVWIALQPLLSPSFALAGLFPVYLHLLVFGWITQLIFGVVFWMFPKYTRDRPRRSEGLGWATFWMLNIGLLLRALGEPLNATQPAALGAWLLLLSALLQWLSGLAFVFNTWGRVKEK